MNIYLLFGILVALIAAIIIVTVHLSFKVPPEIEHPVDWLWTEDRGLMIIRVILIVFVIVVSLMMFLTPEFTKTEPPLSQSSIFLYATSILLLSNFFITPKPYSTRTYDNHPLIFQTAAIFLVFGLLTAAIDTYKGYHLMHRI
jgi:hypothetical protein